MDDLKKREASLSIDERDPIHWGLNGLIIRTVEIMLKELGVSETLSILKPRAKYSGRAMARNFTARFLSNPVSMEAITYAPFCGRCIVWGGKGSLTFYERGAVLEYTACPWAHGPPEMCIIVSHNVAEGACEEVDPNYEIVYTHHMTQGDPSCIGICRRKGEMGLDANTLGKKIRSIEDLDMDEKERDALSFNLEVHMLALLMENFISASSPERVSDLLRPEFKEWGWEVGHKLMDMKDEAGRALIPSSIMFTFGEMVGHKFEVKDAEGSGGVLVISGCVYSHSPNVVCELLELFLASMIVIIDPKASVRYTKCHENMNGTCNLVLLQEMKKEEMIREPLALLKIRFAKGEVTEEEYLRKRDILLER